MDLENVEPQESAKKIIDESKERTQFRYLIAFEIVIGVIVIFAIFS